MFYLEILKIQICISSPLPNNHFDVNLLDIPTLQVISLYYFPRAGLTIPLLHNTYMFVIGPPLMSWSVMKQILSIMAMIEYLFKYKLYLIRCGLKYIS